MPFIEKLNRRVAQSVVGRYFRLDGSSATKPRANSRFTTELYAGLTTFVTMAYIVSTNALILSDTGGTCVCDDPTGTNPTCEDVPSYEDCVYTVKKDIITATCAIACISSVLMGLLANLPFGLAPGMGLNAYFAYTVVGYRGSGSIPFRTALAAVCVEGIIFFFLSIFGIRQWLAKLIPSSIKVATGAGIGLYLAFIGMQSSAGIGLIGGDSATLVSLGACPAQYKDDHGVCQGHTMESATTWMGILGFAIIAVLLLFRVKGAILVGILFVSGLSWIRTTPFTYFPYNAEGNQAFDYFKQVATFHPIEHTFAQLNFDLASGEIWVALITFLYVDILDTTGTMYSMAKFGGFTDEFGDFEGSTMAFITDAVCISLGAVFGTSPVTTFVESGAGITEGGRTGITGMVVGLCFFLSLFFSPIFASFPPWATGPALICVGSMMLKGVREINWDYPGDAIPAFLTIAIMPLTYSIAYGLIAGILSYVIINGAAYIIERVARGRIAIPDKNLREPWNQIRLDVEGGGITPPWMYRLWRRVRGRPVNRSPPTSPADGLRPSGDTAGELIAIPALPRDYDGSKVSKAASILSSHSTSHEEKHGSHVV
ncbi:hypothetical protein IWQ60_008252 [Tieghemiomyces parasiticus]|uniref:Purine transporter n=1 Tax=Tieghemiomyces parasiticus TaxID=78921 RepID=A0A9W7ZTW4_9FUNG|nr:hypothetical protein IWQ60_008252 [Tieghemiomyces parasiticus]